MRHDQRKVGLRGVVAPARRRPLDLDRGVPEQEDVEVDLARPPALALLAAEGALDALEGDQQRRGTGRRVGPGRHVDRDDRVAELGLVDDADGLRRIEPRDRDELGVRAARRGRGRRRPASRRRRPRSLPARCTPARGPRPVALPSLDSGPSVTHARGHGPRPRPRARPRRGPARTRARRGPDRAGRASTGPGSSPPAPRRWSSDASRRTRRRSGRVSAGWSRSSVPTASSCWGRAPSRWRRPTTGRRSCGPRRPGSRRALANHRPSADVLAIACATQALRDLPDLASDNALPRWLAEVAGVPVRDLRTRRRLAMDLDSPLDLLLLDGVAGAPRLPGPADADAEPVRDRLGAIRALAADPGMELLVAGRTSAADLRWLETHTAVADAGAGRGARPADRRHRDGARAPEPPAAPERARRAARARRAGRRWAATSRASRTAPSSTAACSSPIAWAPTNGGWPPPEDRFASDLLLADRVRDPWLRELTACGRRRRRPDPPRRPQPGRPGRALRAPGAAMSGGDGDPPSASSAIPIPDPEAVGEDAELVERLRAEIAAEGPITFARFMERALYEPGHGYYRRPAAGPGFAAATSSRPRSCTRSSAPPSAGCSSRPGRRSGRPDPFIVTEPGAGTGALAAGLLGGLRGRGLAAARRDPLPPGGASRQRGSTRSGTRLASRWPRRVTRRRRDAGRRDRDAAPWSRTRSSTRCRSTASSGGRTGSASASSASTATALRLGRGGADDARAGGAPRGRGRRARRRPGHGGLPRARRLARRDDAPTSTAASSCSSTTRDEPAALHSTRATATARSAAFARHAVGGDAFRHVGRQDLTATVDLAAVRAAAARAGLEPVGETTQAELLAASGRPRLGVLSRPGATIEDALLLRSALAAAPRPARHGRVPRARLRSRAAAGRRAPLALGRIDR